MKYIGTGSLRPTRFGTGKIKSLKSEKSTDFTLIMEILDFLFGGYFYEQPKNNKGNYIA